MSEIKHVYFKKAAPSGDDDGLTSSPLFVLPKKKRTKKNERMRAKLRFHTEHGNAGVHTRI